MPPHLQDLLTPLLLFMVGPGVVYLTSGAVWARLSPMWRERTARGLHVYTSFLLPVLLFTLWDTATGPATRDAELAAQKTATALMTLLLWPVVALPFALLFTWLLSLRAEDRARL